MKQFLGIDVGGTKCAVTLTKVDKGIHILEKRRFDSNAVNGLDYMLERIYAAADELVKLAPDGIEAIGVSCGGPLDSKRGVVLCPPNLPGWINVPICKMLTERYKVPAFLQNDAKACALVEWKLGAGRGCDNMIFLTMGTGMGSGIISGGKLLTGVCDMAGEVGHLRLEKDGPVGFGKAGSFEGFTSGGGIGRQAQELTKRLISEGRTPAWSRDGIALEDVSAKVMAEYANNGDKDALEFYAHIGTMLGKGLALLTDALNPERIVIGSIFTRSEQLLRASMQAELEKECIPYSLDALKVLPAETGEALGDYAATMTALYALDIDPMYSAVETDERVLKHHAALFTKYPILKGLEKSVMDAYIALRDCYENGGKLLICGNGGSCADSEHIVGELMKGFYLKRPTRFPALQGALPAIALTGHSALTTAFNNDCDPLMGYAQQTLGYGRKGDVLIGISTSGNAKNVAEAVKVASAQGLKTIALTGGKGGKLKELCDISIIAPGSCPADVQECHLPIYHTLCAMLEAHFFTE